MLTEIRKNSGSFVTYLLFAAIIIVFVFTFGTIGPAEACGGAAGPGGANQNLAEVAGTTIDSNRLGLAEALTIAPAPPGQTGGDSMIRQRLFFTSRFYHSPLRPSIYSNFGLEAFEFSPLRVVKAMNAFVETQLVSAEAKKMGLSVSDEELVERINSESFQDPKTNTFSVKIWEDYLRRMRVTPTRMEEFLRDELLREKLIALIVGGVTVTDRDLQFYHRSLNEKVNVEYVEVDDAAAAPLLKVEPTKIKTWLQANQDKVKKYYEANISDYDKAERYELRGILLRAPNKTIFSAVKDEKARASMQKTRDAAKKKAEAALALLKKNAADADAAAAKPAESKKDGDKAEANKDGDKAEANKDGDKAEANKDGDKAEAKKDGDKAEAKKDGDKAEADKDGDKAEAKKDDDKAAPAPKPKGITADIFAAVAKEQSDHESKVNGGLFSKAVDAKTLGKFPYGAALATAVKGLAPGATSGVIEVNDGFWIVQKVKTLPAKKTSLADAQMDIATKLYREENVGAFTKTLADEIYAAAKAAPDKKLADIVEAINTKYGAEEDGLDADETGMFARLRSAFAPAGNVPGLGDMPELAAAAFAASEKAPLLGKVYENKEKGRRYIARFIKREEAGEMKAEDMESTKEQLVIQRQRQVYASWLRALIAQARASGELEETEEWGKLVDDQRKLFVEAGGVLPDQKPATGAAAPQ